MARTIRAGAFDVVRALLSAAAAGPLDELGRARVDRLRAEIAFVQNRARDAPRLLLQAAGQLESLDLRLSRDTYLDAWSAALGTGRLGSPGGSLLDVSRAIAMAPAPRDPLPRDLLLDGLARLFTEGRLASVPVLRRAVDAFASSEVPPEEMLQWGWLASRAANILWDYDCSLEISLRAVQVARDVGALEVLVMVDNACGQAAAVGGDLASASVFTAELDAVKEATGSRIAPLAALALAGVRGHEPGASQLIGQAIVDATAQGQGVAVQYAQWAKSVLMNGLGHYQDALEAAVEATEAMPPLFLAMWSLSELIEAATRTANVELAGRAHWSARTTSPSAHTGKRQPAWDALDSSPTSHEPTSSTESGYDGRIAASTRGHSSVRHTDCS